MRDRTPLPTLSFERTTLTRKNKTNWKQNRRARERPLTREGARNGLDLKLVSGEQETRFEGCELEREGRREKRCKGERVRHEAFKKSELQQEIRAVEAHLH